MTRMYQVDDFDDNEPKTAEQVYRAFTDDEREGRFLQDWDGQNLDRYVTEYVSEMTREYLYVSKKDARVITTAMIDHLDSWIISMEPNL